jgi:hypothetical protein
MRARNIAKVGAAVAVFACLAAAVAAQNRVELGPPPQVGAVPPAGHKSVYRLSGVNVTDHLYTTEANEMRRLTDSNTYRLDGVSFYVLDQEYKDSVPLYRFGTAAGRHFLHTDRAAANAEGVKLEGPIGYVDPQPRPGTVPLYGWANPTNGDCFYTTDRAGEQARNMGMQSRGIVCYVAPPS